MANLNRLRKSSSQTSGEKEMQAQAYINFYRVSTDESGNVVKGRKLQMTMALGTKLGQVPGFDAVIQMAQDHWDANAKAGMSDMDNAQNKLEFDQELLGEPVIAEVFLPQMVGLVPEVENTQIDTAKLAGLIRKKTPEVPAEEPAKAVKPAK